MTSLTCRTRLAGAGRFPEANVPAHSPIRVAGVNPLVAGLEG
jgi:hypothetical protein